MRAGGVLPPHPQSSVRPLHFFVISKNTVSRSDSTFHSRKIIQDFQRKRFELCSGIGTNSQKVKNRTKSHRRKPQVEGGAEFPPETPLPPRPLHCWIFLGFPEQTQRAHEAKKRGRGRGPEVSHRLFHFSSQNTIANTNRNHRSLLKAVHFRFHRCLWRVLRTHPYVSAHSPSRSSRQGCALDIPMCARREKRLVRKRKSTASRRSW